MFHRWVQTLAWCAIAFTVGMQATTIINPTQALQVGSNLVQYFVPGPPGPTTGWFVDANTATLLTKVQAQAGVCDFIHSTNGTSSYTYSFGPAGCSKLTQYTLGMHLRLMADAGNAQGGASLDVDSVGRVNIKAANGTSDPPANYILPGRFYDLDFDGTVFRIR